MPYCTNCGGNLETGEHFCSECGSKQAGSTASGKSIVNITQKPALIALICVVAVLLTTVIYLNKDNITVLFTGVINREDSVAAKGNNNDTFDITVPGDFATIQEAIDYATAGQVIVAEPGTYYENIDFKGKDIILRSVNPVEPQVVASTVIDGDESGSVVTFQNGEGRGAVLSGFTITGGNGTWKEFEITSYEGEWLEFERIYGGGILITRGSSPTISNNVIKDNFVDNITKDDLGVGAGIAVLDNSSPLIENNLISGNRSRGHAGGIAVWYHASPVIKNNTIENNVAGDLAGGILVSMMCSAEISGNTIYDNSAISCGGIYVAYMSDAIISGNLVDSNNANVAGGILVWRSGSVTIEDNTVSNNTSSKEGGGIFIGNNASATVKRNIFQSNSASHKGGAIWVDKNCRLYVTAPDDNTYRSNSPDNIYRR